MDAFARRVRSHARSAATTAAAVSRVIALRSRESSFYLGIVRGLYGRAGAYGQFYRARARKRLLKVNGRRPETEGGERNGGEKREVSASVIASDFVESERRIRLKRSEDVDFLPVKAETLCENESFISRRVLLFRVHLYVE